MGYQCYTLIHFRSYVGWKVKTLVLLHGVLYPLSGSEVSSLKTRFISDFCFPQVASKNLAIDIYLFWFIVFNFWKLSFKYQIWSNKHIFVSVLFIVENFLSRIESGERWYQLFWLLKTISWFDQKMCCGHKCVRWCGDIRRCVSAQMPIMPIMEDQLLI